MDPKLDKKIEIREKIILFLKKNKFKLLVLFGILTLIFFIFLSLQIKEKKESNLNSEKYIQAGIYLASNNLEKSKKIYVEIIENKSKFYSILALNTIVEKNLESDKEKILNYFQTVENLTNSSEQKDLIIFKKALFLIKNSEVKRGKEILKELSEKNSKIKLLIDEVLEN